jgi:hypothetical protein
MSHHARRPGLILGLLLAVLAVAPAAPEKAPARRRTPLAEARYQAAVKQFEEIWTFYRQSRTEAFPVYSWSLAVLSSQQDMSETDAELVAALEGHLERMRRLEVLVKKVRRLGFGFSIDVGATEYYRLEAQYWLERARAQ